MNHVQHVSITKGGQQVFQFVCHDDLARAGWLAGLVMDGLCDYHGGDDWGYQVTSVPYVQAMNNAMDIVRWATDKVVI